MTALELHTKRHDGRLQVSVTGPLDRHTLGTLREHLRRILAARATHVDLDLGDCDSVDVDGLLALDVAHSAARRHGSRLRLTNVPPAIARSIQQHNLGHLLRGAPHRASHGTATRTHPGATIGTTAAVPEADAYEQLLSADPREYELDTDDEPNDDEPAFPAASPPPLEADPADVDEQRQVVAFDDDEEGDDRTTP